uniref:YSIRK-type signal peptide-containing protein n=1 Tax=Streptococcus ruminantium TaxID=1917441 RepID=UPI0012DCEA94
MFSHKNKKYSLRKVKNGVASVVIALLFASVTAPVAQAEDPVIFDPSGQRPQAGLTGLGHNGLGLRGDVEITSIGGSGGSRGSEHDKDGCPRPWGTVGDPAGEVCPGGSQGESGRDPRLGGTTDRNSLPGSQGESGRDPR